MIELRDLTVRYGDTVAVDGIDLDLPDAPVPVSGDWTMLRQAVINLLDNAILYTPSSPEKPGVITARVLAACNAKPHGVAFLLWGAHAQALRPSIDETRHPF